MGGRKGVTACLADETIRRLHLPSRLRHGAYNPCRAVVTSGVKTEQWLRERVKISEVGCRKQSSQNQPAVRLDGTVTIHIYRDVKVTTGRGGHWVGVLENASLTRLDFGGASQPSSVHAESAACGVLSVGRGGDQFGRWSVHSTQHCGDWRVGSWLRNLGLIEINGVCYGLRLAGWKKAIIAQRPRAIGVINFSDVKFPPWPGHSRTECK